MHTLLSVFMDNDKYKHKGKEKDKHKHKHKKEICEYLQHTPAQYVRLKKSKNGMKSYPNCFFRCLMVCSK